MVHELKLILKKQVDALSLLDLFSGWETILVVTASGLAVSTLRKSVQWRWSSNGRMNVR